MSADAGEWFQHLPLDHAGLFCRRSEFPRWLRAELAVIGAARSAWLAAIDGNVSGHQGHAGSAGVPSEYVSGRGCESLPGLPRRIRLPQLRMATPPAKPGKFNCGGGCITVLPPRSQYTFSKSIDDDSALGGQGAVCGHTKHAVEPIWRRHCGVRWSIPEPELPHDRSELARSARRTRAFDLRSAPSSESANAVHHGHGNRRKDAFERLEGNALQRVDLAYRRSPWAADCRETPIYLCRGAGHGSDGKHPARLYGRRFYAAPRGLFLNPAAYTAPPPGQWGNAGRDSIIGPGQFTLNASLGRTFRLNGRFNLDLRVDSTNLLNHVTFTSWNTNITSTQFGLPTAANAMRSMQTTLRVRF